MILVDPNAGKSRMDTTTSDYLRVAFVTGGHPYDVPALQGALASLGGMEIIPQHMDDWATAGESRRRYDVVVFYHMLMEGPPEKGAWFQGNVKAALEELGSTAQGVVVLHHALLAYPQWKHWSDLVGIADRKFGYHVGQELKVHVADACYPVTRGMQDWDMVDETYTMAEPREQDGNRILLTVDHPRSMKAVAWTRTFGQSRVFCLQSGHDAQTFANTAFRQALARGIRWAAGRMSEDLPATMPAVWFVEKGKAAIRNDPVPVCEPGKILCRTLFTGVTNGTERNVLMGGNYGGHWPARCGYQNVGRLIEVGAGVKEYAPGDMIFSGGFSQHQPYFVVDVSKPGGEGSYDHLVVKLPGSVDPRHAALFGMASVALHDVRRCAVKLGDCVLVVGAGAIGQLTAQCARAAGAIVVVCDLDEHRLAIVRRCGAHHTVRIERDGGWDAVKALGPFDVVFEDSGAPVLDNVIGTGWADSLVKLRGKVAMIAGRLDVQYRFNAAQSREVEIDHAGHFYRGDLQQVCRLAAEGAIRIEPLIQDVLAWSEAPGFYDRLRDNPASTFGTVFDWQRLP